MCSKRSLELKLKCTVLLFGLKLIMQISVFEIFTIEISSLTSLNLSQAENFCFLSWYVSYFLLIYCFVEPVQSRLKDMKQKAQRFNSIVSINVDKSCVKS